MPDPRPREQIEPYTPHSWPGGEETQLELAPVELLVDFARMSRERQTRREFGPLPLAKLGQLLSLSCRAHSTCSSGLGFDQQFKPVPSAGAVHPIHVFVQRDREQDWKYYDPVRHVLKALDSSEGGAYAARRQADKIVFSGDATLLALVAEPGKTAAKYHHPESLVWRDAGVLIGALVLVAEALDLSFCPLGATGNAYVSQLGAPGTFFGAGMLLVGTRPLGG